MSKISDFRGEYRWLSNFHQVEVELDGLCFPSTEHAYQSCKDPQCCRALQDPSAADLRAGAACRPATQVARRLGSNQGRGHA